MNKYESLQRKTLGLVPVATVSSDNDWSGNSPILFLLAVIVAAMGNTIVETFLYLMPNGRFSPKWAYIPLIATNLLTAVLVTTSLYFGPKQ